MGFPKRLLADHEKVIFDLKPHWAAMIPPALWTIVIGLVVLLAVRFLYDFDNRYDWWEIVLTVAFLAGWLMLAVAPFIRWQFTKFVLTTDRLITRRGVIARHSKEIPLERINDVTFDQSVLERVLGAGDLLIESAGERGQTHIGNVRHPEQVQLAIYNEIESNTNRSMPPARREPTIPEQIEALARLKEQGVLSETEFEAKKADLLKRM